MVIFYFRCDHQFRVVFFSSLFRFLCVMCACLLICQYILLYELNSLYPFSFALAKSHGLTMHHALNKPYILLTRRPRILFSTYFIPAQYLYWVPICSLHLWFYSLQFFLSFLRVFNLLFCAMCRCADVLQKLLHLGCLCIFLLLESLFCLNYVTNYILCM